MRGGTAMAPTRSSIAAVAPISVRTRQVLPASVRSPCCRRETARELDRGEARNRVERAVCIHWRGEIRDRTYENQQHRASGLNLLVTAILLWNTRCLERAVQVPRRSKEVPTPHLAHLSPLGWEHVNLSGDSVWGTGDEVSENSDGMRPLRPLPEAVP